LTIAHTGCYAKNVKKTIVSPSILAADFAGFGAAVKDIDDSGASWVHMDIMDGHFVPNLSFGPQLVEDLRKRTKAFFDVHLMICEPSRFVESFAKAGADGITFHMEAEVHSQRLLAAIKNLGKKAGISIVPSTPVFMLDELLPFADIVLVMTVNPGFGGQQMIAGCLEKVKKLCQIRSERGLYFKISVDGGINGETAQMAKSAGADILVMGSGFFANPDKSGLVKKLEGTFPEGCV